MSRESLAHALSGPVSLAEDQWRERDVDRLHALAYIQTPQAHDLDKCEWAREMANLCELGVDLLRFKGSNVAAAHKPCLEMLVKVLGWKKFRLDLREENRTLVARQALMEFVVDFCPTCSGTGEVKAQDGIDGAQRMRPCGSCHGTGIRKYTNDERRSCFVGNTVPYERLERAINIAHGVMGAAAHEAMRNYFRVR